MRELTPESALLLDAYLPIAEPAIFTPESSGQSPDLPNSEQLPWEVKPRRELTYEDVKI